MKNIILIDDAVNNRLTELIALARMKYRYSIRPIYTSQPNGCPEHEGSCVLINIEETKYLVTAAHIIDTNKESSLYIGGKNKLHIVTGDFHVTRVPIKGKRDDDHFDFAFSRLSKEMVGSLEGLEFIDGSEISYLPMNEGHAYMAIGYPNTKNKKIDNFNHSVQPKQFAYTACQALKQEEIKKEIGLCDDDHIILQLEKYSKNISGEKVRSTKFNGMSGGALIDLGTQVDIKKLAAEASDESCLIGIVIEHHKQHQALIATRFDLIVSAIKDSIGCDDNITLS